MSVSNRQQDAFHNPAKALCRAGNLRVLREAAHLLWEDAFTPNPSPGGSGIVGAFEIYRGKKGGHRMANLRVILR